MAKFEEIKKGKKFYQLRTNGLRRIDSKTGKYERVLFEYYVFETDKAKRIVLASANKLPPVWFASKSYGHWTKEKPV